MGHVWFLTSYTSFHGLVTKFSLPNIHRGDLQKMHYFGHNFLGVGGGIQSALAEKVRYTEALTRTV